MGRPQNVKGETMKLRRWSPLVVLALAGLLPLACSKPSPVEPTSTANVAPPGEQERRKGQDNPRPTCDGLSASKSATLKGSAPNSNKGSDAALRLASTGPTRAVVGFDFDGVPLADVDRATLALKVADNYGSWGPAGGTVDVHPLLTDWAEGNGFEDANSASEPARGFGPGVTWHCAIDALIENSTADCPTRWAGGSFSARSAPGVVIADSVDKGSTLRWDVTADLHAGALYGWLIKKRDERANGRIDFLSDEYGCDGGPQLELTFQEN
jgi:hypothetical protein